MPVLFPYLNSWALFYFNNSILPRIAMYTCFKPACSLLTLFCSGFTAWSICYFSSLWKSVSLLVLKVLSGGFISFSSWGAKSPFGSAAGCVWPISSCGLWMCPSPSSQGFCEHPRPLTAEVDPSYGFMDPQVPLQCWTRFHISVSTWNPHTTQVLGT